ncbi:MAG: 3D domain-containing protein [Chloracidobacterium sp.]|nr:3D domain-containing protein [Chloracidobacterium sp.]MCC6825116.1 3D domain-containing protein [Acidobacteriota bacterium]MCO5334303.1 3D domain-containing protein [Pyrinomonadaceae bacterium]
MKNLVRGGAVLILLSAFVVLIYAQAKTDVGSALVIANDSQTNTQQQFDNSITNTAQDDKKLVKKTVSSKAVGASRGSFSATAYCFSGKTAMGHKVRRGLIAADPRVLKLGSRVYVEAGQWTGTYLVSDTGGAIKGKKIDIWVPGCAEARKFGRRSVQIYAVD